MGHVQPQPTPISWAWGHFANEQGEKVLAVCRVHTVLGPIDLYWGAEDLGTFLAQGRRQLEELPGGPEAAARMAGGLVVPAMRLPPNGQPG